jgi:hypothetical protein
MTTKEMIDGSEKIYEELDEYIRVGKLQVHTEESNNLINEGEAKRWYNWMDIKKILCNLTKQCIENEVNTKLTDEKLYYLWQQRLLLACYIYQEPLRLDYGDVRIVDHPLKAIDDYNNFLWLRKESEFSREPRQWTFFLNHDKVSDKIGKAEFVLDPRLVSVLELTNQKFSGREYLLTNPERDGPLCGRREKRHKSHLSQMLRSIPIGPNRKGIPETTESGLTVDSIRSSRITSFYSESKSLAEKEELAKKMRTSVAMMDESYNKVGVKRPSDQISKRFK